MIYKYGLDPSSKKFVCPKCHHKTFVRYIDNSTYNYLEDQFGKCDRKINCDYHHKPSGNLKQYNLIKPKKEAPPTYISLEVVELSFLSKDKNNFISFLYDKFSKSEVDKAVADYLIGTSKKRKNATIFWQIDNDEKVRTGKVMLYDPKTGKRLKSNNGKSHINWVHKFQKEKYNLKQCLFGLHLIIDNPEKKIALVESEKTAVIMSIKKPQYLWLATGSLHGFKDEMLKPLKSFKITAFPDKGAYRIWLKTAYKLNKLEYKIVVSDYIDRNEYKEGTDLAYIVLINKKQNKL